MDSDSEELLSFNAGDSLTKSNNNQDFMESEYEFETSMVSENINSQKYMLSQMIYEGSSDLEKKKKRMSKFKKNHLQILDHSVGKRHNIFLKALLVYLDMADKLEQIFDSSKNKTLLYLLTLLVNRIENWNRSVIKPLKKKQRYFSEGIQIIFLLKTNTVRDNIPSFNL